MNDNGGQAQGLPFWIVLSETGELLADSKMRAEGATLADEGNNIGCPASEEEVAQLLNVLRATGDFDEIELQAIEKRFRANAR